MQLGEYIAFPELVTVLQKFQIHRIPDVDHQLGKSCFPGSWLYVINSNLIIFSPLLHETITDMEGLHFTAQTIITVTAYVQNINITTKLRK